MVLADIIKKSHNGEAFTRDELVRMLAYPAHSAESFALMAEARRISEEVTGGKAEIHGQFSLDLAPCACDCLWCSFAKTNGVFSNQWRISPEEAVDMAREIKKHIKPETVFIANTSDRTLQQAEQMKDAGFDGVYHALRLREGTENAIEPARRLASIRNFQEAELLVGTCVEPIGPEHTNGEIAELIKFTASLRPAFSGAPRPGTEINCSGHADFR